MSQIINTNILSLNAQRNLNSSQGSLATSLERLSSGLRINSAKDDAAGLAIAERFTSQIRGLDQAQRNANDGISFSQTAEGALGEIGNALQRIRELSVQAANDSNSSSDRQALNNEVQQLISEVGRIADSTQFNGQNILDGTLADLVFQVGANRNQTISVDGVDARSSNLGANVLDGATIQLSDLLEDGDLDIAALTINGEEITFDGATDLSQVVAAINAATGDTGVEAVRGTSVEVETGISEALGEEDTLDVTINGQNFVFEGEESPAAIAEAINAQSSSTNGVRAEIVDGELVLSSESDIEIEVAAGSESFAGIDAEESDSFVRGIELQSALGVGISVSGDDAGALGLEGEGIEVQALNLADDVSVLTRRDASDAIRTVDFALQQVNGLRAELGAVQVRFESTIANLSVGSENLSAARSRIQDADFAAETASLTRAQILQQAGTSVLAQANAVPQNVLALLG